MISKSNHIDKLQNEYNRLFQQYKATYKSAGYYSKKSFAMGLKLAKKTLPEIKNSTILDIGCNHGLFISNLLPGNKIYGIDLSASMLKAARKNKIHPIMGNAEALPFRNNAFDLTFASAVIQCMPDPAPIPPAGR